MNQSNPNAPPSAPQMLPLSRLHTFQDHPYHVSDDDEMARLCESIRLHGVLSPILVRRDGEDYEIVSGHRRVFASRKLGLETIPAVVHWTGAGDVTDPADPGNWACTNFFGQAVPQAIPTLHSTVYLSRGLSFNCPAGATFACKELVRIRFKTFR